MSQLDDINSEIVHSAISTWSGFVYQGKVALYQTLKILNDVTAANNYSLQLDSLEDFAILHNQVIKSIHQVKAVKSTYYSRYESAFKDLVKKSVKYKCNDAFFHLAQYIHDKTVTDIEGAHPPMKICIYNTKTHCPLDEIDSFIEEQISIYYSINFNDTAWKLSPDYIKTSRQFLENIILTQVIKIHSIIHKSKKSENNAAFTEPISFIDFKNILDHDNLNESFNPDYYLYLTKADLNRYYQEYCMELDDDDITEDEKQKLANYIVEINDLNASELVQFIRNIMPNRSFKMDSISDYKDNNIQKNEFKRGFCKILHQLRLFDGNVKNDFVWVCAEKSRSFPTIICEGEDLKKDVCRDIITNIKNTDLEIPYAGHNLITSSINVDSLYLEINNIIDVEDKDPIIKKNYTRITAWGKVSLIKLADAKLKLNENNS
ncbi:hypothetical protein B0A67_03395 [Flavobacterium aquidurense]|uniref:ABC-three component system protein n=1 Tax=Flavobacterium aquidurense TaxID=362413 RepID=UPI00091CC739|nr:ABC-three component system protein [Flavobacterium aquidurense]OXA73732.1 hypothetical protein B0A67_03395 [Flavobacterium aquidurense]SHG79051.1 hypothetical protein SAMN05444481_107173 [Flavobacterium frigidimaris]